MQLCVAAGWVLSGVGQTAQVIGFGGPEIFPIDPMISHLRHGDFNGDGLEDLVVVNNSRSKLNLLINRTGRTNRTERLRVGRKDVNQLPPDARFEIESLTSEKRISAFVVADLNHDGRPDLAYYGEPKELVVQYREGEAAWGNPRRIPVDDGRLDTNALDTGDLNGDGRTDLVLLGESVVYYFAQEPDGSLAEPEPIPYTGVVRAVQVLDIDGDGRQDLLLVNWDLANPFRFRLQAADGALGPEIHFTMPAVRSYWPDDLDGNGKMELITIAQKSGRAQIANFERRPGELIEDGLRAGQFQVLPLGRTSRSRRGVAWADLDQDGRSDLLVAEPESGRLAVALQRSDGRFSRVRYYPTLTGVTALELADWDGDGRPKLFVLSSDERQVGVAPWGEGGRISFPEPLPIPGRPLAIAAGPLKPDAPAVLAAIIEEENRRYLVLWGPEGEIHRQPLAEQFKGNADALVRHDVDQDGLTDLVVLIPYEKLKVLRQQNEGGFEELDLAAPGGGAELPALSAGDVDGDGRPELLLAQKNFVRAVVLARNGGGQTDQPWSFRVKEQINGASSSSRIVAATAVRLGQDHSPALLLLDVARKMLTVCRRDQAGLWRIQRNLPLPETDFNRLETIRLGATPADTAAFTGLNDVAWLPFSGETWQLVELDDYETPIERGYLLDVISGDLNQDGLRELVFLETNRHYLDIVAFQPPNRLVPVDRWPVFEERTFRNTRAASPEPREALIQDVTGDGRPDLIVLVHDRVLLYPQTPPAEEP